MRKLVLVLLAIAPLAAQAAAPSEGVALSVRRGFFTEIDIGGFNSFGGLNQYSNLQTYLQLGVGYDISQNVELGIYYGTGANAANCFFQLDAKGNCLASDNFTNSFIGLSGAFLIRLADRFYVAPKGVVGWTTMDPAPVFVPLGGDACTTQTSQNDEAKCKAVKSGIHAGAGVGIEYATYMDHFSIGIDVIGRFIVGPNIFTVQYFPRVKYTF